MHQITLIGAGTIGLSFCALHLTRSPSSTVTIHDKRPDLLEHIRTLLPGYLPSTFPSPDALISSKRLILAGSLAEACTRHTSIVQEQGPEKATFKTSIWPEVEKLVSESCHLWTSTSGIPASIQSASMKNPGRLVVVHPFNPPHIMPLLEIVPSPATPPELVSAAVEHWKGVGQEPVILKKEVPGFVLNRLAFVLLREACGLVGEDVLSAKDLDTIVENSLGVRWSIKGPFASYNDGGGVKGIAQWLANLKETVQVCWNDAKVINFGEGDWEEKVIKQTMEYYGVATEKTFVQRDLVTRRVLETLKDTRTEVQVTAEEEDTDDIATWKRRYEQEKRKASEAQERLKLLEEDNMKLHEKLASVREVIDGAEYKEA